MLRDKSSWDPFIYLCVSSPELTNFVSLSMPKKNHIILHHALPHSAVKCLLTWLIFTHTTSERVPRVVALSSGDRAPKTQTVLLSSGYIISYTEHQVVTTRSKANTAVYNFTRYHSSSLRLFDKQSLAVLS